jgi:hypothetical protein
MTAEWIATFYEEGNQANKTRFDLVESGGQSYLLNPRRTGSFPFTKVLQWEGTTWVHERTDPKPVLPPQPRDPEREEAIENLKGALSRFPSPDALLMFYAQEGDLEARINGNYNLTVAEMREWCAKIAKALAAQKYGRFELTRDFRHSRADYGDLKIEGIYKEGTQEHNWENAEWYCRCKRCEKDGAAPRRILARTLLEIEAGSRNKFICGNPCNGR